MKIEKWVVRAHNEGVPDVTRMYEKVVEDVEIRLRPDEMLFKTLYVSVDPYLHGIARDTPLGDPMGGDSIMQVVEAGRDARFKPGDVVHGFGGWRTYLVSHAREVPWPTGTFPMVFPAYRKLEPEHYDDVLPLSTALGVMGGPGMTAWGAVSKFLNIQRGNTLVISGASGTIGEIVGQLGKRFGARVIGTAGSPDKAERLRSLGFDAIIDYKHQDTADKMHAALREAAPGGVDRYFDQIGGVMTDVVFSMLNIDSRVAVCWQWATQVGGDHVGPRLLPYIMFPRTTIRGIFSPEWFTPENWDELRDVLGGLIRRREIRYSQTVHDGFDHIPAAYHSLYVGSERNRGKVLVKL